MTEEPKTEGTAPAKNKGGRPRGSKTKARKVAAPVNKALLNDPAVQALINAAVGQKFDNLMAELVAKREVAGNVANTDEGGDIRIIRQLASAITEMGDQGSNKAVRVAPEEVAARAAARESMESLILEYRAKGEFPIYDLSRTVYLDEVLVAPSYVDANHVQKVQRIEWAGVPDESMTPIGDAAKAIHAAYMRSIGGRTKTEKVPYSRATANPNLRVVSEEGRQKEAPQVGRGQGGESNLRVVRPNQPGQVTETQVLGTVARPARQIA